MTPRSAHRYDAIVVGAGPAGAAAAHMLARGGARVLLLEKARLPRYKPCGGGITPRARSRSPLAAACVPETAARLLYLQAGGRQVQCALPAAIGMTMRDRFDAQLVERAVAAGAELRDGTALSSIEREGDDLRVRAGSDALHAGFLIGADGANGVVARLSGFAPATEPATAIEAEVAVSDRARDRYEDTALLDFDAVAGGYAWIFGKGDHLSAGVYTIDRGARRDLRAALSSFLERHRDLRAGRVILQRGHRVPLAGGRSTRRNGGVLLAGDAASLADPLTGEGISYALASGQRAGASVLGALQGAPEALEAYDRFLDRDLCRDLRYARMVARVAYRFPQFGVRLADEHAGLRTITAAAICGTLEYRALAVRLLRDAPKLRRYMR